MKNPLCKPVSPMLECWLLTQLTSSQAAELLREKKKSRLKGRSERFAFKTTAQSFSAFLYYNPHFESSFCSPSHKKDVKHIFFPQKAQLLDLRARTNCKMGAIMLPDSKKANSDEVPTATWLLAPLGIISRMGKWRGAHEQLSCSRQPATHCLPDMGVLPDYCPKFWVIHMYGSFYCHLLLYYETNKKISIYNIIISSINIFYIL